MHRPAWLCFAGSPLVVAGYRSVYALGVLQLLSSQPFYNPLEVAEGLGELSQLSALPGAGL